MCNKKSFSQGYLLSILEIFSTLNLMFSIFGFSPAPTNRNRPCCTDINYVSLLCSANKNHVISDHDKELFRSGKQMCENMFSVYVYEKNVFTTQYGKACFSILFSFYFPFFIVKNNLPVRKSEMWKHNPCAYKSSTSSRTFKPHTSWVSSLHWSVW